MKPTEFKNWRKRFGLRTRKDAAAHFGVTDRTIKSWETGDRPVPVYAIRIIRLTMESMMGSGRL